MDQILGAVLSKYKKVSVLKCNAEEEEISDFAEEHNVEMVPTILAFKESKLILKLEGVKPVELTDFLDSSFEPDNKPLDVQEEIKNELADEPLRIRIRSMVDSSKVYIFMKGTAEEPKCKFSRALMEIVRKYTVTFKTFNILEDLELREGLKRISGWKTYPQVYVNGKLLGGLDNIKELESKEELDSVLNAVKEFKFKSPISSNVSEIKPDNGKKLEERLREIIDQDKVVLFMKGTPAEPRCGFSQTIVTMLKEEQIKFSVFDILEDNKVREGLKKYSNWPTYPQLYVDGELIGGLDILKEMQADAEDGLKAELGLE